jgi:hypothetical protein
MGGAIAKNVKENQLRKAGSNMEQDKQALAAPTVQEPKFWYDQEEGLLHDHFGDSPLGCIPLYTTPPAQPAPVQKGAIGAAYQKSPWDGKGISMPPPAAQQEPVADVYMAGNMQTNIGTNGRVVYVSTVYSEKPLVKGDKLYTTSPAAQQDIQRLSALVRAQQITIDKLEQALSAPVQDIEHCIWARNGNTPCQHTTPPAQPAPVQPVASLKESDVLMMAEAHGIDPSTKGLYGFYIDCISNQPAAQPAPATQRQWVGLTDEERWVIFEKNQTINSVIKAIEAKLKEKNTAAQPAVPDAFGTREGEHPKYIQGWNDCRAEMLKGMKP